MTIKNQIDKLIDAAIEKQVKPLLEENQALLFLSKQLLTLIKTTMRN